MLEALDRAARRSGMSRSAKLRELLASALSARDLWPPTNSAAE